MAAHTRLPAPAKEVWDRLLRWEDQPSWMHDADSVRVLTPHREGVGVRIAVRTRVLNVPLFTEVLEVVEWDPPRRLTLRHTSLVRGVGTWELRVAAEGSAFRWTEEVSLPVPILGELALFVYRPVMRFLMRRSLANLGRLMEEEGAGATQRPNVE